MGTALLAFEGVPLGVIGLADCREGVIEGVTFSGFATDDVLAAMFAFTRRVTGRRRYVSARLNTGNNVLTYLYLLFKYDRADFPAIALL